MASGWIVLGAFFCLLGTVALVAIVFVAARWFIEQGRGPATPSAASSLHGPAAERID